MENVVRDRMATLNVIWNLTGRQQVKLLQRSSMYRLFDVDVSALLAHGCELSLGLAAHR